MRAGYFEAVHVACFRDDMPEPQITRPDDVNIQIRNCGICGSEIHAYHGKHPFRIPPIVSGHEASGDVVEVGPEVTEFKPGDRVVIEPHVGCGKCWYCKHGMYHVCPNKKVLGAGDWSGALGEYVVTPEKTLVHLADHLSYEEGALIEPVANGMFAVRNVGITPETTLCIIGAGPIGIGDALCARLWNPKTIIVSDIADLNLERLKLMCPEAVTVNSRRESLEDVVLELTDGVGADKTFLAFGSESAVTQACAVTRRSGQVIQHALMEDGIGFCYRLHQQHELDFRAFNMYQKRDFELICEALAENRMDLSHFVTQRYPIGQFKEAIDMADRRPEPVLKVMMEF